MGWEGIGACNCNVFCHTLSPVEVWRELQRSLFTCTEWKDCFTSFPKTVVCKSAPDARHPLLSLPKHQSAVHRPSSSIGAPQLSIILKLYPCRYHHCELHGTRYLPISSIHPSSIAPEFVWALIKSKFKQNFFWQWLNSSYSYTYVHTHTILLWRN